MFRSAIARYSAMPSAALSRTIIARRAPISAISTRFYSPPSNLDKTAITGRVIDVLKTFNKGTEVADGKVTAASSFQKDLGLDSLDIVEFIVAVEEEFSIEIPDKVADDLKTIGQTVEYIKNETDAS